MSKKHHNPVDDLTPEQADQAFKDGVEAIEELIEEASQPAEAPVVAQVPPQWPKPQGDKPLRLYTVSCESGAYPSASGYANDESEAIRLYYLYIGVDNNAAGSVMQKFICKPLLLLVLICGMLIGLADQADAMRINLKNTESFKAVMSGAATTTNPTVRVEWTGGGGDRTDWVQLSGATAVKVVDGLDAMRTVTGFSVYNGDTAAVTVTFSHVIGSTSNTILVQTLQVGDTLYVDQASVKTFDNAGNTKETQTSTQVQPFAISVNRWTKTDGITVNPASAATTNHGLVMGTDGTNYPHLETIDGKAATTAVVSRCTVALPANYVAGSAVTIRLITGMKTTVSDTTAVVGLNVYSNSNTAQTGSADLNTTSAQSCNSLTVATRDYVITPTSLVAGQDLHIKLTQTITDGATATAVIGTITHAELRTSVNQ